MLQDLANNVFSDVFYVLIWKITKKHLNQQKRLKTAKKYLASFQMHPKAGQNIQQTISIEWHRAAGVNAIEKFKFLR